jgi:hypothetical protein
MDQRPRTGRYLELLLFTLSAVLLYRTGIGAFLFLVPLQILASRRGTGALLAAGALFLAGAAGIQAAILLLSGADVEPPILIAVEAIILSLFLLGLVVVNVRARLMPRALHRMAAAALLAGAAAVPLIFWLSGNTAFQQAMGRLFTERAAALSSLASSSDVVANSFLSSLLQPDHLRSFVEAILLRSLVPSYLVFLAFSWWAGQAIAGRTAALFGMPPRFRFAAFRLEAWWVWPLIGAGALVLLDLFRSLGLLDQFPGLGAGTYPVWNAALVVLFLFGLQGLAILRFLFEKYRLPRLLWPLAVVLVGSLLFRGSPAAGTIVLLIIPVFGVSENWIRYRVPRSPEPTEQN